jgi:hypothetical protein
MAESLRWGAMKGFRKPFEVAQIQASIKDYVLR